MLLSVCFCHVTYEFKSYSTLYSCLNVKEFFPPKRSKIWILSEFNWIGTHNHLVFERTLSSLVRLVNNLSFIVSTYLCSAFDCILLSSHVRISEWIRTLHLPEYRGNLCLKQARNLKFKRLQLYLKPQPRSLETNAQPFMDTCQTIELSYNYLSVQCFWLQVPVMSCTRLRVNPCSKVTWISRNFLPKKDAKFEF